MKGRTNPGRHTELLYPQLGSRPTQAKITTGSRFCGVLPQACGKSLLLV